MSILLVVAPCNLFNSHLDVASQITGALRLPGATPRAPLVGLHGRNVKKGAFFSLSFSLLEEEEVLYFQSKRSPGSPSARGADRSKVRVSCRLWARHEICFAPLQSEVNGNPNFDDCWQNGSLEIAYHKAENKIKHDSFSLEWANYLTAGATVGC